MGFVPQLVWKHSTLSAPVQSQSGLRPVGGVTHCSQALFGGQGSQESPCHHVAVMNLPELLEGQAFLWALVDL